MKIAEVLRVLNKQATGEWDDKEDKEWLESLKKSMNDLARRSGGKVKVLSVKGFDRYQGPYARIKVEGLKTYEVWTLNDGEYVDGFYVEDFPITNTRDNETPGYKAQDIEELLDVIKQARQKKQA